jgi:hypothetical protein
MNPAILTEDNHFIIPPLLGACRRSALIRCHRSRRCRSPIAGICSRGCCHGSRISVDPQTQLPDYILHFLFQEISLFFSFPSSQIHKGQQKAREKFPGFRPYKTECVGFVGQFKDITTGCLTPVTRLYQLRSWQKTRQVKQPTGVTAHSPPGWLSVRTKDRKRRSLFQSVDLRMTSRTGGSFRSFSMAS